MCIHMIIFTALFIAVEAGSTSTMAHVPALTACLSLLGFFYGLAAVIPGLAVSVRRLHDIGKSGWWMLLAFVPVLGLLLLFFFALDSEPGLNRYGPSPKLPTPYAAAN